MITDIRARVTRAIDRLPRPVPQMLLPAGAALVALLAGLAAQRVFGASGLTLVLIAIATPILGHYAILAVGFGRAMGRSGRLGRSDGPATDWLRAYLAELPQTLRVYYWLLPFRAGRGPEPTAPAPNPAERPRPALLFIHGYGANSGLWEPAVRWFARRGYPVGTVDLTPPFASIDDYRDTIEAAVEQTVRSTAGAPVAIVAHSMGALATRAWLRDRAARGLGPTISALVTLGAPFAGTSAAAFAPGHNTRQMLPDSAWLASLRRATPTPPAGVATTVIIGWNDHVVDRPLAQTWPGARTIRLRRIGHVRLAVEPALFPLIERAARRRAPPTAMPDATHHAAEHATAHATQH